MADGDARVKGSHRGTEHGSGIALDEDGRRFRFGEPGGDAREYARRKFWQRLAGSHQAEIDIRLQSERTQRLIKQFAVLAGRDEQRTHLARPTQLSEHRRELDALGARTDDEGEGWHYLIRGHAGTGTRGKGEIAN